MYGVSCRVGESIVLTTPEGRVIYVWATRGGQQVVRLGFDAAREVKVETQREFCARTGSKQWSELDSLEKKKLVGQLWPAYVAAMLIVMLWGSLAAAQTEAQTGRSARPTLRPPRTIIVDFPRDIGKSGSELIRRQTDREQAGQPPVTLNPNDPIANQFSNIYVYIEFLERRIEALEVLLLRRGYGELGGCRNGVCPPVRRE